MGFLVGVAQGEGCGCRRGSIGPHIRARHHTAYTKYPATATPRACTLLQSCAHSLTPPPPSHTHIHTHTIHLPFHCRSQVPYFCCSALLPGGMGHQQPRCQVGRCISNTPQQYKMQVGPGAGFNACDLNPVHEPCSPFPVCA